MPANFYDIWYTVGPLCYVIQTNFVCLSVWLAFASSQSARSRFLVMFSIYCFITIFVCNTCSSTCSDMQGVAEINKKVT